MFSESPILTIILLLGVFITAWMTMVNFIFIRNHRRLSEINFILFSIGVTMIVAAIIL